MDSEMSTRSDNILDFYLVKVLIVKNVSNPYNLTSTNINSGEMQGNKQLDIGGFTLYDSNAIYGTEK